MAGKGGRGREPRGRADEPCCPVLRDEWREEKGRKKGPDQVTVRMGNKRRMGWNAAKREL
jgi:hypothetical protein